MNQKLDVFFLLGLAALTIPMATGCARAKAACTVIDIADTACETFIVQYKDENGQVQRVEMPVQDIKAAAVTVMAAKMRDAGSDQ